MKKQRKKFVVCIKSEPDSDLEVRKIYQVLPDEKAAEEDYIRVIDESGEDYLYPAAYFFPVELPQAAEDALLRAA
jgi:primosomal protein N'